MTNPESPVWMTAAALAGLEEELARLTSLGREQSPADQGRAAELRRLIRLAEVDSKPDDGLVEPGMMVTIRFTQDESTQTLLLGERELVGTEGDVVAFSPDSPLGKAITGHFVGDLVTYRAPSGATIEITILDATPFR